MLHDLRYSFRLLLKNPGFAIVAVLSLALGIGATTTIFSVVYAGLLRSLPYREPDRLVMILGSSPKMTAAATTADVLDWRAANHVFEQIEMYLPGSNPVTVTAPGLPERVKYQYVTQGFFPMLGTQPVLGRVFMPDDQERGIVISYGYWQRRFQGDRAALGQKMTISGDAYSILGWLPFSDGATARFFQIAGKPGASFAEYVSMSPGAFGALRIPLRKGRTFNERDTESAPWVAMVNEAFVRRNFPNQDPLGKMLTLDTVEEEQPREIVGVVSDVRQAARAEPRPQIYVDFHQQPMAYPGALARNRLNMAMVVRGAVSVAPQIRALAAELDRTHPVFGMKTMNEVMYDSTDINRFYTAQLVGFAGMALLLASVGIYGVMSYAVSRRRREIGIRMALGARNGDVLRGVLGQGLRLALIGLAIGLAGSFALTRWIASYLFGVKAIDPATFAIASVVLIAVAIGAVYRPARRATEVDPMVVLRCE